MEMNASARPEVSRETDHVQERRAYPGVDTMLQELCSSEHTPSWNSPEANVPDQGSFETFIAGAGI
jgi:hypothetical protein